MDVARLPCTDNVPPSLHVVSGTLGPLGEGSGVVLVCLRWSGLSEVFATGWRRGWACGEGLIRMFNLCRISLLPDGGL